MAYTFGTTVPGDMDSVRIAVTEALSAEGFGILTEIDVAATLQAKLGVEMEPYVILGACNPTLAHQAIEADVNVGALLPCNVVLRKEGDAVAVVVMDPRSVMGLVNAEGIDVAAAAAKEKLSNVVAVLDQI